MGRSDELAAANQRRPELRVMLQIGNSVKRLRIDPAFSHSHCSTLSSIDTALGEYTRHQTDTVTGNVYVR